MRKLTTVPFSLRALWCALFCTALAASAAQAAPPAFNGNIAAAGRPIFSLSFYLAACNGTTDDSTAIQSAVNAAHTAGGGIVLDDLTLGACMVKTHQLFPNAGAGTPTYCGIILYSNVEIEGIGPGSTIEQGFASSGQGGSALFCNADTNTGGDSGISFSNITLQTNAVSGVSPTLSTYDLAIATWGAEIGRAHV